MHAQPILAVLFDTTSHNLVVIVAERQTVPLQFGARRASHVEVRCERQGAAFCVELREENPQAISRVERFTPFQ